MTRIYPVPLRNSVGTIYIQSYSHTDYGKTSDSRLSTQYSDINATCSSEMIAMSTLHTSCSVSVDPQQQALFAIQCLISPRKHRMMPLQAHRVNVTHLGTTRRSDEPARSVGHVVHTACCAQCVCKYNCFSRWMNHPPRTMRLERPS